MKHVVRASWFGVVMLLSANAYSQPEPPMDAGADPSALEEAHARFRHGIELYDDDKFRAALAEFLRAYELAPSYRILYNVAQVQYQLRDYAAALRSFERYLDEGGDRIDAARRKEVRRDMQTLRARVASLEIIVSEPGAEVFIDDALIGTAPLSSPVYVNAGRRKITARLEGYVPVSEMVDALAAQTISVRLSLVGVGPVVAPPSPPVPAPTPSRTPPRANSSPVEHQPTARSRDVPWVAWTVTGALAAGATVTGVLALRASSDLQDKRATGDVGREALDDASRNVKRYAIATDLLGAGALIAGGVSLYLTLDGSEAPSSESGTAVRLHVGPTSLGLSGSF